MGPKMTQMDNEHESGSAHYAEMCQILDASTKIFNV